MIDLNVVVYPGLSRDPQPDPLFVLVGGPGQGAAQLSEPLAEMFREVRRDRDLVFVDQRGTGESNGLPCEADTDDLQAAFSMEFAVESLRRCLEEYDADPRFYTTPVAMDDLDEVRAWLGYERINLWGGSYGTRAALVYLRRHGEHVRSAVFDGAVPLEMVFPGSMPGDGERALDLMLAACEAEDACRQRFPDLRRDTTDLLERLERRPERAVTRHPRTGELIEMDVSRRVVASVLWQALYSPVGASMLPLVIDQAHGGDFRGILAMALASELIPQEFAVSSGMFFSVICAEDMPWAGRAERESRSFGSILGDSVQEMWERVCEIWPRGEIPEAYRQPFQSSVPALVLSGSLDPVTPPRWGERLAESLPDARHVVVPGAAHGTSSVGCVPEMIADFIRDASPAGLDDGCVGAVDRPPFFVTNAGPAMAAEQ